MKKTEEKKVWSYQMWHGSYETLYAEVGEAPLIIMVSSAFVDLMEKINPARKALKMNMIWMTKEGLGIHRGPEGQIVADFSTITKMLRMRRNKEKVIFFMGHAACSFATIPRLRAACPGSKFISYVFDWMQLFCPIEHIDLWKQYTPTGESIADKEYEAIDEVIAGETVDAVLYKDYGPNFPMLSKCESQGGTHWIPPVMPAAVYQDPPREDVREAIAYIGTIVPKRTHGRDAALFDDIMMEDIFREVIAQDYSIDAYSLTPDPEVLKEYGEIFPAEKVRVYSGLMIPQLLPVLQGRYKWGWMAYKWTTDLIMDHIKISIPIKFFTYLALGVPILISREMEACGRIVDKYGCGIRLGQDEIPHIREITAGYDYGRLLNGVKMARKAITMKGVRPVVEKVLRRVLEMPYEETTFGREEAKKRGEAATEERKGCGK